MSKENEGKCNDNDLKNINWINTLENCGISRMGGVKNKGKNSKIGFNQKSIINVKRWF